uniref:Protein FAM136A n=1 Tax=Zea mays TaxID=4577 RepID=A0A804NLA2_MAIZE
MGEQVVTERIQRKLEEANATVQQHLAGIQDHVNFTMQEAINNCVENCGMPVLAVNNVFESEMAKFQERLNRSLMVCQDKFEAAKLQKMKTDATQELESCVNRSIDDSIRALPYVVQQMKSTLNIN